MAGLAIWMALVHRETDIVVDELAIAREVQLSRTRNGRREWTIWRKEWVSAFSTEKVLFVVGAFTESGIVERDEPFVNDRSLAMETAGGKSLLEPRQSSSQHNGVIQTS